MEADYATWNKASETVLIKNGFKVIKHKEKGHQKRGEWVAENQMALDWEDWKTKQD